MNHRQANVIAMHIDYCTDVLRATNDVLDARAALRKAQAEHNVRAEVDAHVKVISAERILRDLYGDDEPEQIPDVEPLPDCGETKAEHADYYAKPYRNIDHILDDPRRGQGAK